jgi:outer membrane receptor protein involved in Fe transport
VRRLVLYGVPGMLGKSYLPCVGAASFALLPFLAGTSMAAAADPPAADAAPPIEEIVVTATKRAESITKVPISMSKRP